MQIFDNLILIHNINERTTHIYDPKSEKFNKPITTADRVSVSHIEQLITQPITEEDVYIPPEDGGILDFSQYPRIGNYAYTPLTCVTYFPPSISQNNSLDPLDDYSPVQVAFQFLDTDLETQYNLRSFSSSEQILTPEQINSGEFVMQEKEIESPNIISQLAAEWNLTAFCIYIYIYIIYIYILYNI